MRCTCSLFFEGALLCTECANHKAMTSLGKKPTQATASPAFAVAWSNRSQVTACFPRPDHHCLSTIELSTCKTRLAQRRLCSTLTSQDLAPERSRLQVLAHWPVDAGQLSDTSSHLDRQTFDCSLSLNSRPRQIAAIVPFHHVSLQMYRDETPMYRLAPRCLLFVWFWVVLFCCCFPFFRSLGTRSFKP